MTRREAIDQLEILLDHCKTMHESGEIWDRDCEALGMAIAALRGQTAATNADHIRAMDDDELAKWLCGISTAECCDISCPGRDMCERGSNGLAKWLRLPYKTEG